MTDRANIPVHPTFKHLPSKIQTRPDTQCAGCPKIAAAGHGTCETWRPSEMLVDTEKWDARQLARIQWGIKRRQLMSDGVKGSEGDSWYPYNAENSFNYADFASFNVTSVSGTQLTLTAVDSGAELEYQAYSWNETNEIGGAITGYYALTCVNPGDVIRFSENSVLSLICWPVVTRIVSVDTTAHTLVVDTDRTVTSALDKLDPEDEGDVSVKIYQHAGNPENWQFMVKPDLFYGRQAIDLIDAADVPEDGLVVVNATGPVMHPGGFDPLHPTWTLEGKLIVGGTWENISSANNRLYITPEGPTSVALKTTKSDEADPDLASPDADLTLTYSQFRLTYWVPTDVTDGACSIVGHARCIHAIPDPTLSAGNYDAVDGVGVDSSGMHYYCELRRYLEFETEDTDEPPDGLDDHAIATKLKPSGVVRFPASGRCIGYNTCNKFESGVNSQSRSAPSMQEHMVRGLNEVWAASNHKRQQFTVGVDAWFTKRVMHSSLSYLSGYWGEGLETPGGLHEQARFSGTGQWGGEPVVVTDIDGNETLSFRKSAIWDYQASNIPLTTTPDAGHFPRVVDSFDESRDPLDPSTTTYSTKAIERIGWRVERDTGLIQGRGIGRSTMACASQNVVIPNLSIAGDGIQTRAQGTFERLSAGTGDGVVALAILRPEWNTGLQIGTREVHSVTSAGTNLYEIELANGVHSRSHTEPDGLGGTMKVTESWEGGGVYPIVADDWQQIDNYDEPGKSFGSTFGGVERGDSIGIADDTNPRRFVIVSVDAFGGSSAGTWSGDTPSDDWSTGRNYTTFGQNRDVITVYDESGDIATLESGDNITFHWNEAVALPGAELEWTEYQSDTWAIVEDATFEHGRGQFTVPATWFVDKPETICFRATNVRLLDHRGITPATAINKTQDGLDSLDWTWSPIGVASMTTFDIHASALQGYLDNGTLSPISISYDPIGGGNVINGGWLQPGAPPFNETSGSSSINISGNAFGPPAALRFVPDGYEVLEAKVEITITSGSRTVYGWNYGSGGFSNTFPYVTNFVFLKASGPIDNPSWEVAGTASSSGTGATGVYDITDIMNDMVANSTSGTYHSYCAVPSNVAVSGGLDLAALLEQFLQPTPVNGGDVDVNGDGVITPNGSLGADGEQNVVVATSGFEVTFGSISLGNIAWRSNFPDSDKNRLLINPRMPTMGASVS